MYNKYYCFLKKVSQGVCEVFRLKLRKFSKFEKSKGKDEETEYSNEYFHLLIKHFNQNGKVQIMLLVAGCIVFVISPLICLKVQCIVLK